MRETIGGTWIMQIVIVFIFLLVAFLALSMNYSKAFKIKNEAISIIEKYEGITDDSLRLTGNYLFNSGYRMTGKCDIGNYGVTIRGINSVSSPTEITNQNRNTRYSFCISKHKSVSPNFPNRAFYEIRLFFRFNLPIVGNIYTFDVEGQSKDVTYPLDGKCSSNDRIKCLNRG